MSTCDAVIPDRTRSIITCEMFQVDATVCMTVCLSGTMSIHSNYSPLILQLAVLRSILLNTIHYS